MNTLVIVLIAAVCLFGAYALYGRWLANKWGIDPTAKTPAVVHEDGRDYVPTDGLKTALSERIDAITKYHTVLLNALSAGCPFCCGSCWAASSSVPSPTSALCTLPSRMTARAWAC